MKKLFLKSIRCIIMLGMSGLCACSWADNQDLSDLHSQFKLEKININQNIKQIALDENQDLLWINQQGELWKSQSHSNNLNNELLIKDLSPETNFYANHGKIVASNKDNYLILLDLDKNNLSKSQSKFKLYSSEIKLAKNAGMVILPLGVIAVQDDAGVARLIRAEIQQNQLIITAKLDTPVLSDSQPIQINLNKNNLNNQGHIAVLAQPDGDTYRHGALGDTIEAAQVNYVERHTLKNLSNPLKIKDFVFEANRFQVININNQNYLVSVMSGGGKGAKTVLIQDNNQNNSNNLEIVAESRILPSHRWQSPFVFKNQLFAVQTPHLSGRLVQYHIDFKNKKLEETLLGIGLSNHEMGSREMNLVASTDDFALIPNLNHQKINILVQNNSNNPEFKLLEFKQNLPAKIIKTLGGNGASGSSKKIYLLLENGEIWAVYSISK